MTSMVSLSFLEQRRDDFAHHDKKRRRLDEWETRMNRNDSPLSAVFARPSESEGHQNVSNRQADSVANPRPNFGGNENDFFKLRLAYVKGGPVAKNANEERIVLFRSGDFDRQVGKITFNYSPADLDEPLGNVDEEARLDRMAQARIHYLDVLEPYRGRDLGGLLLASALDLFMCKEADSDSLTSTAVRCQLDAEEDTRRHDKLKGFYQNKGFQQKPNARVQYLNNNDAECYRKIPMQLVLRADERQPQNLCIKKSLVRQEGVANGMMFLPVRLLEAAGRRISVTARGSVHPARIDWLMVEDEEGSVQFRTTGGRYLIAGNDNSCYVDDVSIDEPSAKFHLYKVPDSDNSNALQDSASADGGNSSTMRELWMLESAYGSFLQVDERTNTMVCSKEPTFWQSDSGQLSLTCTKDTPPRRMHYRKAWETQTVAYVREMHERYLGFNLQTMSVRAALNAVKGVRAFPFRLGRPWETSPSVRSLCFQTAEAARNAGQPDWVQLVALVHGLGSAVAVVDDRTKVDTDKEFDWTIITRSRVIGCAAPNRTSFSEFRRLNADENSSEYSSPQGMYDLHCGLANVLLAWTGQEYMYNMLRHNKAGIPDEGLAMLRLFTLGDWHTYHEYGHLENQDDRDMKTFVAEFDQLRRAASTACGETLDMSDEECDCLWDEHYKYIVEKFGLEGALEW